MKSKLLLITVIIFALGLFYWLYKINKKIFKISLGILISIGFLYLAFKDVDFIKIVYILKNVNYYYLILATIVTLTGHGIRSFRWKFLLKPIKQIKVWTLFKITIIAFMSNNILPFRMAEIVRAYLLGEKENISKTASFATIVLERFFDLLGILIISSIFFLFAPTPDYLKNAGLLLMLIGIFFVFFIIFLKYKHDFVHKILNKLLSRFAQKHIHKIAELINNFVSGLEAFSNFTQVLWIILLSLIVWLFNLGIFYSISMAFGLNIPLWKNFFPFLTVIIGVMIPSAPGFVGTFHEFCKQGLILAGVTDNNIAASYAILIHGLQYIDVTLLGIYFLINEKISLFKITEK